MRHRWWLRQWWRWGCPLSGGSTGDGCVMVEEVTIIGTAIGCGGSSDGGSRYACRGRLSGGDFGCIFLA